MTEFGGNIVRDEQYESLEDIAEKALKYLDFSDLVSLADDEKIISEEDEVRHGAASEPVSTIPETFRQDISQHRLIRISEPHKTVTDYPISDAGSNELSNYRLSFITDYNAYRLIADSPKVGPGVYVHQFTYKDTAESIYAYLHERDMQALHEEAAENPAIQVRHRVAPPVGNYHFPEDFSYPSGPKAKYTANVTAIKTLKQIESEHRHATAEEQDILAHYSGWGGVADAFDPDKKNWSKEYAELKDLLTDKEYSAARESTLTAFYTEPYIIDNIYKALENMGFTGGDVLDPAVGTGNFFGSMPPEMAENSRLHGVELDSLTARIAKELYPEAKIQKITKADIFTQRTINVDRIPTHVETALEALHLSMNIKQTVDLEYISQLCGKDKDEVIEELGDRIYCNPAKNTGGKYSGWETAEEYLSGHVRTKLSLAQEVAKTDPAFERNVAALLDNQPPRVEIQDIGFRVGTIYIPPEMYQQFIYDTFDTPQWQRQRPNMRSTVHIVYLQFVQSGSPPCQQRRQTLR